jgi:hypothetical protein
MMTARVVVVVLDALVMSSVLLLCILLRVWYHAKVGEGRYGTKRPRFVGAVVAAFERRGCLGAKIQNENVPIPL